MTMPRVSVIIPAFQMGYFLRDAVASIFRQRPAVSEMIVIDSGSTDSTPDIVRGLAVEGAPIRLMELDRCPPGAARNAGLADATGHIVAFLDADDLWPANKLARQLDYLQAHPDISAVSGFVTYFDELDRATLAPAATARVATMFGVHVGAWIYRRSVFESIGTFDESFVYSEDVDLLMRIRENRVPFTILRDVTLYYRRHPNSMMSRSNPRKHSDFRMAVARSLARRRGHSAVPADLGSLEAFLEPQP
jgi:glycosyltransferase involved in cell wall biosynthesis